MKAGLPKHRFHDLRHTAASIMLNRGVPALVVSKILGHSKPSTTLDIYGHLIPIMQEGVAQTMDELFTPIRVEMSPPAVVSDDCSNCRTKLNCTQLHAKQKASS